MFPRYKHYYRQWRSPHVHSYHPGYQRKRVTANMSKHSRNKIHSMSAVTWPRFNKMDPWEDSLLGWHLNFNCNSLFPWHGPRYSVLSPNPNFGFFEPLFCSSRWSRTCWPAFKVLGLHTRSTIPVVVHTHTWRHSLQCLEQSYNPVLECNQQWKQTLWFVWPQGLPWAAAHREVVHLWGWELHSMTLQPIGSILSTHVGDIF